MTLLGTKCSHLWKRVLVGTAVVAFCLFVSILTVHFVSLNWPIEYRFIGFVTAFCLTVFLAPIVIYFYQRIELQNQRLLLELERMAHHDELTGLLNRRAFMAHSTELLDQPERVALLLADIDWFKRINDTYGHAAGDEALRHIAAIIRANAPEGGILARLGGEEFVALFVWKRLSDVQQTAETIRANLEARPFNYEGKSILLTTSIGVAIREHADDVDRLLCRADQALYKAKNSGRNKTLLAA